jgi:hypothetical protein
MRTRHSHRSVGPIQIPEAAPAAIAHGAEDAVNRLAGAVEGVGARTAKSAGHVSGRLSELGGQLGNRVSNVSLEVRRPKPSPSRRLSAAWTTALRRRRRLQGDAVLKTQLAKTSRDLAHESSDLSHAISSLNAVIRANRKAAARGRTRLIGGVAIGAALMYHLDSEHGRERRSSTARRLRKMAFGGGPTRDQSR